MSDDRGDENPRAVAIAELDQLMGGGPSPRIEKYTEAPDELDQSTTTFRLRYEGMKLDNESVTIRVLSGLLRRIVASRTASADQEVVRRGAFIGSTMDFGAVAAARDRANVTRKRREQGDDREHLALREERSRAVAETSAAEVLRLAAPTMEKIHFDRSQVRDLADRMDEGNRSRVEAAIDDYGARMLGWTLDISEKLRRYVERQREVIGFALEGSGAEVRDLVAYLIGLVSIHGDPQGGLYECPEISAELWRALGDVFGDLAEASGGVSFSGEVAQHLRTVDLVNLATAGKSLARDQEKHIEERAQDPNAALPLWHTFQAQQELLDHRLGISQLPAPKLIFFPDYSPLRAARDTYRQRVRDHAALEVEVASGMFAERALAESKQKLDRDGDGTLYQSTVARIRSGDLAREMVAASAEGMVAVQDQLKEQEGNLYYQQLMEFTEEVLRDPRASALESFVLAIRDASRSAWGGEVLRHSATRLIQLVG